MRKTWQGIPIFGTIFWKPFKRESARAERRISRDSGVRENHGIRHSLASGNHRPHVKRLEIFPLLATGLVGE